MPHFSLIEGLRNNTQISELINEIEKGNASIHEKDENNLPVLAYAIQWDLDDFAEYLLEKGAKFNELTFHVSAFSWNVKYIKKHLEAKLSPDLAHMGAYPLNTAICSLETCNDTEKQADLLSSIELLIEYGANVNQAYEETGFTPLLFASHYGSDAVVKKLLDNGADFSAVNKKGRSALHQVASGGYTFNSAVIKRLIAAGADINVQDTVYGQTPLHLAVLDYRYGVVRMLRQCGADDSIGLTKELPFYNESPYYDIEFPIGTSAYQMAVHLKMDKISDYLASGKDWDEIYVTADIIKEIYELIQTGQKKKIALAFEIGYKNDIDEATIMGPWIELIQLALLDDSYGAGYFTAGDYKGMLHSLLKIDKLYLPAKGITTLPHNIGLLKKLEWIELKNNQLTELPESIGKLSKLNGLYVNFNALKELPNSIGKLKSLEGLYLYDNDLEMLPDNIGKLKKLEELRLEKNKLKTLPKSLGKLKNLKLLWLEGNPLSKLPEDYVFPENAKRP